ncbi:hypothetical protein CcaverHIS002_0411460 [Cutaneotrichosporon cavernicola]|uniref:DUF803-domain-containing protein n=1 Tax=Cutaneotrichosporon cavernicola TaxID=279322 RepID=A0AA48L5I1_9TREE|nr:uncharacterized protein CcaverHIS019_0411380 [Cutaneotrichosporon cavernicola]BEI84542.1 hypothetical protein CcaverHIS002_0411460 [Cutaneotrichosporon cavernicola]BEI92318.1 hypothetical protein CcaverHIS019_0411380 [Cutaneotrichosporon cavernicola]BEJ00088.1 hypothetical protein CcaverHIS631_0411300 [Cutaneotrichosporon cavernicola]BEJ07860.1 hypothetical protein CcaverHIS641_0411290 [Cutaneotrichosporon cavernicola]
MEAMKAAAWLAARADPTASPTESAAAASSSGHGLNVGSNPSFKIIGVCLAVGSGLFIGSSFVVKKKGLIKSTAKAGNEVGEGHAYLKSPLWWTGMTMMVIGEILNFVAYAFTVAILVTPLGSVSVVVAAVLSHFFLKETLTFFGWIGCILCILGSIILALNAPQEQSVRTINEFKHLFISPGFLVWAGLCIAASLVVVFYVAPRWGKTNMMPYISVCSLIGGISVSCTQGLGSAIITSIQGDNQVKNWFFWFLLFFVVITLLIEINYLNKALELFNTSMVVPVYFCYFTSATMVTSFILYKGLKAPALDLVTMVLAFLVTCFGITLLQMSKVDPKQLSGLDRRTTMLLAASKHGTEAEEKGDVRAMEEPGMDALRGGFGAVGSIIRARSVSRRMSNASAGGFGAPRHNTAGLAHLPRYQLSDNPMPDEEIAMSPQTTGRTSTLKFGAEDTVHQYAYTEGGQRGTGHSDAFHSTRQSSGITASSSGSAFSLPIVQEGVVSTTEKRDPYVDPYAEGYLSPIHHQAERKTSFSQLLKGMTGTSPTDDQVRGGPHRGVRDYPHIRGDEATEREERAALVAEPEEIYSGHESDGDGDIGAPQRPTPPAGPRRPMGPRKSVPSLSIDTGGPMGPR